MSKELNPTKMQILSMGSICGMVIGSIATYFFHSRTTVVIFLVLFFFGVWGIRQFYLRGNFS